MLRLRRSRVVVVLAFLITVILIRVTHSRGDWDRYAQADAFNFSTQKGGSKGDADAGTKGTSTSTPLPAATLEGQAKEDVSVPKPDVLAPIPTIPETTTKAAEQQKLPTNPTVPPTAVQESIPHVVLPDRKIPPAANIIIEDDVRDEIHPIPPNGRQELPTWSAVPTTIHWQKQKENFPVPTESIILLPTGQPAQIPKIQHRFKDETPDAKIAREKRQSKVKEQFLKAWAGYKKFAWGHDELSPVSGKFRDPFCGWAATLVDTLDTLWIMGLHEEFEEAVRAVELIDFTTTPRLEIPVFETTIRYLGGLLSAYDVSGEKHKSLLDKAVELAEVLMGAFDTPNRMPILHYPWKPTFASQPHRANQRSNLAELGSLSMEFTRLAQLTKEPRYYDAVARITNALSEWQDRGTALDGVFPEWVDASGCNFSAPKPPNQPVGDVGTPVTPAKLEEEPEGYKPVSPATVKEPKPRKKKQNGGNAGPGTLEIQMLPGEQTKAQIVSYDDQKKQLSKREVIESKASENPAAAPAPAPVTPARVAADRPLVPSKVNPISGQLLTPSQLGDFLGDWDCTVQGLDAAAGNRVFDKFSMGGGQDSTYEYFPKQWLLLGGREEKYKKMYLKTIEAVRQWMLFRPMIPGDKDILFSGSVLTAGHPDEDSKLGPEVEHLTCFIGGMVGMGAKIFGIDGDLEIAKKLTEGCVWAYGSTPSGVMAEGGSVMPCASSEQCTWNRTAYENFLDPMGDERDQILARYLENKEALEEAEAAKAVEVAKAESARRAALAAGTAVESDVSPGVANSTEFVSKPASTIQRREASPEEELPIPITHDFREDVKDVKREATKGNADALRDLQSDREQKYLQKSEKTEAELNEMYAGRSQKVGGMSQLPINKEPQVDLLRPKSHKEYVASRIKTESLPPGYVSIHNKKYILRPEAIESVWYMYRITGDATWQDKGWKMFESIINATSSKYGHSAIYDATLEETYQIDEMESFWLAETLKYFYLLYSTPDTISLDDWVLNTEAHPFKRPTV